MITGRIKGFEYGVDETFQYLINLYNPVIYASIHAESIDDPLVTSFVRVYNVNPCNVVASKYIVENPDCDIWSGGDKCYRYASMFYHIKNGFDLVQNSGVHFDYVIRWRADIKPSAPFVLPESPKNNVVYIPKATSHYDNCPADWVPDQYAVGTMPSMQLYSATYTNLFDFYAKYNIGLNIPEQTLYNHITKHGVSWEWGAPWDYTINPDRF